MNINKSLSVMLGDRKVGTLAIAKRGVHAKEL